MKNSQLLIINLLIKCNLNCKHFAEAKRRHGPKPTQTHTNTYKHSPTHRNIAVCKYILQRIFPFPKRKMERKADNRKNRRMKTGFITDKDEEKIEKRKKNCKTSYQNKDEKREEFRFGIIIKKLKERNRTKKESVGEK